MGTKPTKEDVEYVASSVGRVRGLSKEDLAGCIASLSDMAHTGENLSLPEIRINDEPPDIADIPGAATVNLPSIQKKVRSRLQRQMATNEEPVYDEDVEKQLQLLECLDSQDDDKDWASMRRWLVWCLHNNLDDKEPDTDMEDKLAVPSRSPARGAPASSGRQLQRQNKVDMYGVGNRGSLQSKKNLSIDSDKSSSGQNSFDSCASGNPGEG